MSAQELDERQESVQQVVEDGELGLKSRSNLLKINEEPLCPA
jgi:hypothetical protein